MNLNISEWKTFEIGRLFTMMNGKGITQEEIADNEGDFIAVQSGEDNNGVMGKIDLEYCKSMKYTYSEKPCLTVARSGSAGFVSYQASGCVVGDSAKILLLPDEVATESRYLFLQTILTANRFKYTYGRKVTEKKYLNDVIDLPVQHNPQGTITKDPTCKYSDKGYIPDWQFMEDYIKSLHYKPLATNNKKGESPDLNVSEWKEFYLRDLFEICNCVSHDLGNLEEGKVPFIGRTAENNGLQGFVDVPEENINDGNCISLSRVASNVALWQLEPFATSQHITTFRNSCLNIYSGLFICTMMNKYMDGRFSYGRTIGEKDMDEFVIKLPVDSNGEPDWQFMENYIKSLPYGDRLL